MLGACSKSEKTSEEKESPLVDMANRTVAADSGANLAPFLEKHGYRIVNTQKLPAQMSNRRATAAIYQSQDGASGGVVYMQRATPASDGISWHWYFADGAPDSVQLTELNGDGLWDVRVFMRGGTTRDFVQGESFTLMADQDIRVAMNGSASGTDSWKAFDGDTATAWQAPAKDAHIDLPTPLGIKEGRLRLRLATGSTANRVDIFAGDRKVQSVELQRTNQFQEIDLDDSVMDAPGMRLVVEGPAATIAISELEIR
ncbi:MAG TPA: hypothetical protein VFU38_03070 [Candidatus Krumholzibacteria bacterium]|nr:hypothetical protein [Candidatus Krumholzibacteria bacterium]